MPYFRRLISKFWCTLLFQVNGHLRSTIATFESHSKLCLWKIYTVIYIPTSHWQWFVFDNSPIGQILEWIMLKFCPTGHWDPMVGMVDVDVDQVARWSLNSMANWPRDSRSPGWGRHRSQAVFLWAVGSMREFMWIVGLLVWLFFFASGNMMHHDTMNDEPCDHKTEIVGFKWNIRWTQGKTITTGNWHPQGWHWHNLIWHRFRVSYVDPVVHPVCNFVCFGFSTITRDLQRPCPATE